MLPTAIYDIIRLYAHMTISLRLFSILVKWFLNLTHLQLLSVKFPIR